MKNDKGRSPGICFYVDTPDALAKRGHSRSLSCRIGFERSLKPPKGISEAYPQMLSEANPYFLFTTKKASIDIKYKNAK